MMGQGQTTASKQSCFCHEEEGTLPHSGPKDYLE